MSSFLEMGGYGTFVWPSYGLSAGVLIGILMFSLRRRNRARRRVADLLESGHGHQA